MTPSSSSSMRSKSDSGSARICAEPAAPELAHAGSGSPLFCKSAASRGASRRCRLQTLVQSTRMRPLAGRGDPELRRAVAGGPFCCGLGDKLESHGRPGPGPDAARRGGPRLRTGREQRDISESTWSRYAQALAACPDRATVTRSESSVLPESDLSLPSSNATAHEAGRQIE